mmetsp:Transcript_1926/g.4420  ORF Transcript_1926/g.4420 Transcript_1926/m.4420 type:complete len:387 (+) Transcript_1926:177-1337(+)
MSFMVHDKWENVLFVHYKIPVGSREFELLQRNCPFRLDVVSQNHAGKNDCNANGTGGSYIWLGLVFLTERNVGPGHAVLRGPCTWLNRVLGVPSLITHHGVNVRTYVEGDGIFFYSLECDSFLATEGARQCGIPYRFARIRRDFALCDEEHHDHSDSKAGKAPSEVRMKVSSTRLGRAELAAGGKTHKTVVVQHGIHSTLDAASGVVDLCRLSELGAGGTATTVVDQHDDAAAAFKSSGERAFGFCCEWTTCLPPKDSARAANVKAPAGEKDQQEWTSDAAFLLERYRVYSLGSPLQLTGLLTGTVRHDPWPVQKAEVKKLEVFTGRGRRTATREQLEGSDSPCSEFSVQEMLEELVSYRQPDHVCFSPGVGPVSFDFLRQFKRGS